MKPHNSYGPGLNGPNNSFRPLGGRQFRPQGDLGPRMSQFVPPQLMRPPSLGTLRPPPPPPNLLRPSIGRNSAGVVASAGPTTTTAPATKPVITGPQIVYASEPTRYTKIVKPSESEPVLPGTVISPASTNTSAGANGTSAKNKDAPSTKDAVKKNKKQKTSHSTNLVSQVTTTVSKVKKSKVDEDNKNAVISDVTTTVANCQQSPSKQPQNAKPKKERKNKKNLRYAGGTVWEDKTLDEWEPDDFRMFAGDLGNDVTEELLTRHFSCYPSFVRAKVVRDRFTNKSKGFGFLSFQEPADYTRAMKEMNGRYVGSRPIKLRKSMWRDRSLDVVAKKNKEKQLLGLK